MQIKLDKWLYDQSEYKKTPFQYMYLKWEKSTPVITWVKELPKNINFKKIIKWKINKNYCIDVNICAFVDNSISNKFKQYEDINFKTTFLKSHLQKCIRRKIKNKSIKTAFSLINKNPIEFLRRLPIIMIEDCSLHYSFSYIIWLMAAYPEYELKNHDINYLLKIVAYLSSTNYKDPSEKNEIPLLEYIEKINILKPKYLSVLYSVGLRKSYGGLNGDMELLSGTINKWINRFNSKRPINDSVFTKLDMNKSYVLNKNLFLSNKINYSAIDFHCFPGILKYLNTLFPDTDTNLFKKLIWENISSINYRNIINDELNIIIQNKKISNYEIHLWNIYKSEIINIIYKFEENIYE